MKNGRLPFYPKDGSTICLYNCLCEWEPALRPPTGERERLGPMGARRRGRELPVAKAKSKTATGRKGEVVIGKKGEKGRFVTLRSGRGSSSLLGKSQMGRREGEGIGSGGATAQGCAPL